MRQKLLAVVCVALCIIFLPNCSKSCSPGQKKPSVFFEKPEDGSMMDSPFKVVLGLTGMQVKPALEDASDKNSGHFVLLIDDQKGFIEKGQPVAVSKNIIHLSKGETSAVLELEPGEHTLTVQFSDGGNLSYGKEMSQTIKITVNDDLDELPPSD